MISRREALKKLLFCCAALTSSIPSVARARQNVRWGSLISFRSSPPSQDILAGVKMAIDEINKEGGVLGREVKHIIYEASDQNSAVKFTRRLLFRDEANFIGAGFLPSASEQIYKILCSNKTLMAGYTSRQFPYNPECPYYFTASISDFQMGKSLSRGIFETFGNDGKKIAVIGDDIDWARNISAGIDWTAKEMEFEKVMESFTAFQPQKDFKAEIEILRKKNPSFLFVPAAFTNLETFAIQSTELELKKFVKIVFPFGNIFLAERAKPNNMADIYAGLPWYWKAPFPGVERFVSVFRKRMNRPPSYYAAQAYTIVRLILDVSNEVRSIESERLIGALENRKYRYLKEDEIIRKEDHVNFGQLLIGIGKPQSEIKEEKDVFEIIKVVNADCIVDAC